MKKVMRTSYMKRIRELFDEGFSRSELAIMYRVSEWRINLVLEGRE